MGTQQNEIPRCACGMPLMFSTRERGGVLCGPCQREKDGAPTVADLTRKEPQWSTEWPTEPGVRGGLGAVTGMDPFKAAGVRPVRTQPGTGTPPKRDSD